MVFEPLLDVVAAPMGDVAEPRGRGQLLVAFHFLDVMNALAQVLGAAPRWSRRPCLARSQTKDR